MCTVTPTPARAARVRSNGGSEEDSVCWICLEPGSNERGQLARPCSCPRDVHLKCLSRWQLQQAGKSEERACRFCRAELPDWKSVLAGPPLPPADPIMVVTLGNVVHKIRVKPGEEGQREFQQEIRRLFRIPDGIDFEVTFRCKAPCLTDTIQLEGMSSYHAATHCASLMAAQRMAAMSTGASPPAAQPATATQATTPQPAQPAQPATATEVPNARLPCTTSRPGSTATLPCPTIQEEQTAQTATQTTTRQRTLPGHSVANAAAGMMRRVANSVQNALSAIHSSHGTPTAARSQDALAAVPLLSSSESAPAAMFMDHQLFHEPALGGRCVSQPTPTRTASMNTLGLADMDVDEDRDDSMDYRQSPGPVGSFHLPPRPIGSMSPRPQRRYRAKAGAADSGVTRSWTEGASSYVPSPLGASLGSCPARDSLEAQELVMEVGSGGKQGNLPAVARRSPRNHQLGVWVNLR